MERTTVCLVVICIWLIYCLCKDDIEKFTSTKRECNDIDGRCYSIHTDFPKDTYKDASELLAKANKFSIDVLRHMRDKYLWKAHDEYYFNMTRLLLDNYNPDALIENNPPDSSNTSYVLNKGSVYALCLRNKTDQGASFIPINDLKFVILHEMAHMSTEKIGHDNQEFWVNFKILLNEAVQLGLYKPVDYSKTPINYCSLHVDFNPYFSKNIPLP